jgi:Flp pilus assembly protein TadG
MTTRSVGKPISLFSRLLNSLRALKKDLRGSVAPLLALAAIPLLGGVGASVDYSRAAASKTAMQGATDATALALAKEVAQGSSSVQAQPIFNALFTRPDVQVTSVSSQVSQSGNSTAVTVSAAGSISTTFMRVMGYAQIPFQASSTASMTTVTDGCVLALDGTASSALSMGGSTNVNLSNCSAYSDSNSSSALSVSGSATLSAESIGAVGGVSVSSSNVTTTNGVGTHLQGLADPYADVVMPSYGGCTQSNLNVKTTLTIDPGVYCNGISVNAGGTLTLNPGIYFIDRGSFSVNGGGTVNGSGVTLIFTSSTGSNWATLTINGNAVVNLTAPIGGATAGLVVFGDRNIPLGTSFKLNGGSSQAFGGAIYIPTGSISYSGGANTSTSCTQIIGDTVAFTGNSSVAINCSSYATKPFGPTNLRLSS